MDHAKVLAAGIDNFFLQLNAHSLSGVMDGIAENGVMRIPSSNFVYDGKDAIEVHLDDFLKTFKIVNFRDFKPAADPINRRLAVHFNVSLTDHDGEATHMSNANFFEMNEDGKLTDILIFASAPLSKGFEAGSS
ncbi:MAG: nuclear transport factor 2 family protein [Pseudomonadota bacterium]